MREKLRAKPLRWRVGLGFLLTDELFSLSGDRRAYANRYRLYYALGAGGSFYLAWNVWTAAGIVAGAWLPDLTNLGLDFAIAATFIALVIPDIKSLEARHLHRVPSSLQRLPDGVWLACPEVTRVVVGVNNPIKYRLERHFLVGNWSIGLVLRDNRGRKLAVWLLKSTCSGPEWRRIRVLLRWSDASPG